MKKTYNAIKAFVVMLSLFTIEVGAQPLSGLYTIDQGSGATATNFTSFNAFATAINTNGMSGPVTVNVIANSGPYVEQVTFNQITGMAAANRVIINGNNNLLTFNSTSSANPHTLKLNGTDYLTVNDLNVEGTGTTYAMVVHLTSGAKYNVFNNCKFTCPLNGVSSSHCPFAISGGTSPTSGGASGDYNAVNTCTMENGYYGYVSYGVTSSPFTIGNTVNNCLITDWYAYGVYHYYNSEFTIKNSTLQRPTRTTSTTMYPMYSSYNLNCMIEGNKIHKLFESQPGATGTIYWYMYYCPTPGVGRNVYRNNIITDWKHNGTYYNYMYYGQWDVYNNTYDFDYPGGNHTGTYYNLYAYSNSSYGPINITNNIITMRKPGSGARYPIYAGGTIGFTNTDYNNIVPGTGSGTNSYGYYSSNAVSHAAWQAQGMDPNGVSVDPVYANQANGDVHPTDPTINNMATPMGLVFDQEMAVRNPSTPDIGALEFLTPVCSGLPSGGVGGPTWPLCPGEEAKLSVSPLNSNAGITYQWRYSTTSSVGPFTVIPTANSVLYTTPPVNQTTWYSVVMTCTAPGGGSVSAVSQLNIAAPSSTTVPYFEGFEGIGQNNRKPTCSWSVPNMGGAALTAVNPGSGNRVPRNGTSFASFMSPASNEAFFTEGIQMEPGITYSAAVWYATEYTGATNWSNLSIWVGPNQNMTGMVQVASISPAASGPYKLLDNTFTVPSSGLYYVAIRATGATGAAQYLSWDDLSITIPCQGPGAVNSPTLNLSVSSTTVCAGDQIQFNVTGADTYSWNSGQTSGQTTEYPAIIPVTNYIVWGTNTITGCTAMLNQPITVNPAPAVFAFANQPITCSGSPVILTAAGANSYVWSNSAFGQVITVTPVSTSQTQVTYTVIGTNSFGCTANYPVSITVNPLPNVTANTSMPADICPEEMVSLTASGAATYQWLSSSSPVLYSGNPINVIPGTTTTYTVYGTNANGCVNKSMITQNVTDCTGLENIEGLSDVKLYPNPTTGAFVVELNNGSQKTVEVVDITGRVVMTASSANATIEMNIADLASGVYYVKINADNATGVVKVVKQ